MSAENAHWATPRDSRSYTVPSSAVNTGHDLLRQIQTRLMA